jgi:hypothetical protein
MILSGGEISPITAFGQQEIATRRLHRHYALLPPHFQSFAYLLFNIRALNFCPL